MVRPASSCHRREAQANRARLGGEEFAMLLPETDMAQYEAQLAIHFTKVGVA